MQHHEITLTGFNGATDDTDNLVIWLAGSKTDIDLAIEQHGIAHLIASLNEIPQTDAIDFTLPDDAESFAGHVRMLTSHCRIAMTDTNEQYDATPSYLAYNPDDFADSISLMLALHAEHGLNGITVPTDTHHVVWAESTDHTRLTLVDEEDRHYQPFKFVKSGIDYWTPTATTIEFWDKRHALVHIGLTEKLNDNNARWVRASFFVPVPTSQTQYRPATDMQKCPHCGSNESVEYNNIDVNGTECAQEAYCNECGAEWLDTYSYTGIRDLSTPEA